MAIIRFTDRPYEKNPWAELEKMRREMDRWTGVFSEGTERDTGSMVYPPLNISEDNDNVYVRAEMAGVPATGLEIFIEGDTLTIKGERKQAPSDEKISYHRREIAYGRFNRAVTLPTRIITDKVSANEKNGILTIVLPKAEEVKPKQIKVDIV